MASPLIEAFDRASRPEGDLVEELIGLGPYQVRDAEEARAICSALERLADAPKKLPCGVAAPTPEPASEPVTPLSVLASLFQRVQSEEACAVLEATGVKRLIEIYDRRLPQPDRHRDDLLFVLKVLTLYRVQAGVERIAAAVARGLWPQDGLWEVIFRQFDAEHPHRQYLCDALREPLPTGFCAVAYLDFCNGLAIQGALEDAHPFDTEQGKAMLEVWLADNEADRHSFAHSATAALPFIGRPERDQLLSLALDHASQSVQLEAAWASAMVGSAGGVKLLRRHCLDPRISAIARAYLRELGHEEAVPAEALEPRFLAEAEACAWLSHPQEYGRPPQEVRLLDDRTLAWPPTKDERHLFLVAFTYDAPGPDERPDRGVVMVGSVTFALFGETSAEQAPEDAYALHCCWELELHRDPRAPEKRTVEAGRALLASAG